MNALNYEIINTVLVIKKNHLNQLKTKASIYENANKEMFKYLLVIDL
jgi:hypothetical protein